MIVTFTADDLDALDHYANVMAEFVDRHPRHPAFPNRTKDPRQSFREGLMGEWAVADALDVARRTHRLGSDGGIDVHAPSGDALAVRFRRGNGAWLMAFDNHPVRADAIVLVVGLTDDCVRIVGCVSTTRFYREAEPVDVGYGPSLRMPQHALTAWADALPRLRATSCWR